MAQGLKLQEPFWDEKANLWPHFQSLSWMFTGDLKFDPQLYLGIFIASFIQQVFFPKPELFDYKIILDR